MKNKGIILPIVLLVSAVLVGGFFALNTKKETDLGATVLQVYQGGTGAQTFTAGECLMGNGTGAVTTGACGGTGDWATTSEAYYWTTNFTSNFNTALNATTTLDLTSLVVTNATTTNFAVSGLTSCDTIDTDANGTLRCGTDNAAAGGTGSNWSFGAASGWLTPSTTIGIIVQASSTITNLTVDNSTTTLKSVIGTDGAGDAVLSLKELWSLGFDDSDGDSFVISSGNALGTNNIFKGLATGVTFPENATTTKSFTVSSLISCDTIDTDANGLFKCGSDNAGAGGTGSNWLFGAAQDFITPSSTVGIIVQASSTITSLVVPDSLTGTGVTNAWNDLHNATTTYPGFATQFATALNATSTWAGFQSEFNKYLNATSTWTAFDANWDRKANATTTQTNFAGQFNTALNATTTLDLTTLIVTNATTTNSFHPTALCLGNVCSTAYDGTTACAAGAICTGGHTHVGVNETYGTGWNGDTATPEKDDVYDYLHQMDTDDDGDVDTLNSSILNLLNSDYRISILNATTTNTDVLKVYTGSTLAAATSTNLAVSNLVSCDTIDTDANGTLRCGTDNAGTGGTGSNWLFGAAQDFITPSTTVGIILQASSTITSLILPGTVSGAGFTNAWNALYNATTTLNGFTPANYLLTTNFDTEWNSNYNATTTLNGLTPWTTTLEQNFWNGTTTWAGFQGQFNTYLNATTTLDLTTLFATNLKSTNATTTKFTVGTTNPTNNYNFFLTGGAYLDSATTTDSLFVTGYASSTVGFRSGGLLDIGGVTTLRGITTTTNTTTIGGGLKVYKNASDSPTTTLEFL